MASMMVAGCGQDQKRQDALLLDYLGEINALIVEHYDVTLAVTGAYKLSQEAVDELRKSPDEAHLANLFSAVSNEKEAVDEALDQVNGALSFLETTPPSREAETLRGLMIEGSQTAKDGLVKLSLYSGIRYETSHAALDPTLPKSELSAPPSEALSEGLRLIMEACSVLQEAQVEADGLLQPLAERYTRQ